MKKQIIDASGAIAHFIKANGLAEWQPGSYSSLTDPDAGTYNYPEVGTYYAYATLIPSLAASISTDTKYGRWASMGGLQFTTAAYSRQIAMMEEAALTAKTASGAARALGWVGGGLTVGSDIWGNINYGTNIPNYTKQ